MVELDDMPCHANYTRIFSKKTTKPENKPIQFQRKTTSNNFILKYILKFQYHIRN